MFCQGKMHPTWSLLVCIQFELNMDSNIWTHTATQKYGVNVQQLKYVKQVKVTYIILNDVWMMEPQSKDWKGSNIRAQIQFYDWTETAWNNWHYKHDL